MTFRALAHALTPAVLVVAAAVVPAGCGAGTAQADAPTPPAAAQSASEPSSPPPRAAARAPADDLPIPPRTGEIRVMGLVFHRADRMSQRVAFDEGTVLAVPAARFQEMRRSARSPWGSKMMLGAGYPIREEDLHAPGVGLARLRGDGTYALDLAPGAYVFCLLDLGGGSTARRGGWVERSFEVTLTDEPLQTVIPVVDRQSGELELLD